MAIDILPSEKPIFSANSVVATDYTFDASAKTLTINEAGFKRVLYVFNSTYGELLYNPYNKGLGGTLSGTTLTLDYPTDTFMNDSDNLLVVYEKNSGAASSISANNSSTTNLTAGNSYTFTGVWERNFESDVMVNLYADQNCNLLLQFSNDGTTVHSQLSKDTTANINEFTTAVKGARYFRVVVTSDSLITTVFSLQTQYGVFRQGNAPANLSLSLDADAMNVRPTVAQDEIRIGRRTGVTGFTKFAYRDALTASPGEQVVWTASDNTFVPMESADTYTITYDGTGGGSTDGAGTTGALTLAITHVNADGNPETFIHTLGTDGSDVTTQTGFGINRMVVASNGGLTYNASDITATDTTNGNTQAHIRAENSVTEQAIFVTGGNHDAVAKWLYLNLNKVSGGGNVRATIKGYIYNRQVDTRYLIFRSLIDTSVNSIIDITDPVGFNFSPTDVIWFTVDTDTNNSEIDLRFSLNEYQRT